MGCQDRRKVFEQENIHSSTNTFHYPSKKGIGGSRGDASEVSPDPISFITTRQVREVMFSYMSVPSYPEIGDSSFRCAL